MSKPSTSSPYDVFLSYRSHDPDKTWVRGTLLPRLEAAGIRTCVDYRDFRLGEPIISEMERAVITSRYTLAVLTPHYLESTFTEFENLLAQQLGLEEAAQHLLLVLRQPCQPSLRLRYKLWSEMTNEVEFEENLPRLIQTISGG